MGLPRSDFTPGPTSATTPSPIDGEADIAIPTATKKNAAVTTVRVAQPYRFVVGVEFESLRHPPRRDRGRGKTDAADAATAARNTLSMPIARLRDRRGGQDQVVLQALTTAREQLNAERLRAINALTALVRAHDLGIDARRALSRTQIRQMPGWRPTSRTPSAAQPHEQRPSG